MTAAMVQRVVVRMLFDTAFCQRVYQDPDQALSRVDLTHTERQWLIRPDPRAYRTDPHRTSRALTGLLEEYLVAGALAIRQPQGLDTLYRFFSSQPFHDCIQYRGSMADAFGHFLISRTWASTSELGPIAQLEQRIAQVRRVTSPPGLASSPIAKQGALQLSPRVGLLSVPVTTLPRYSQLRDHLSQHEHSLLAAVLDSAYMLPHPKSGLEVESEFVLIDGTSNLSSPAIEAVSHELGALLQAARTTITCERLCTVATQLGAESDEALDIIQGLVDDHLLDYTAPS